MLAILTLKRVPMMLPDNSGAVPSAKVGVVMLGPILSTLNSNLPSPLLGWKAVSEAEIYKV